MPTAHRRRKSSKVERRYSGLEIFAACFGFFVSGGIVIGISMLKLIDTPSMIQTLVDKGVDVVLAVFVTCFLANKFERRRAVIENAIQYMKASKSHFIDMVERNSDRSLSVMMEQALDCIEDAQVMLCQIKLHSFSKLLGRISDKIQDDKSMRYYVATGRKSDGFDESCKDITKMYKEAIAGLVNK